jgi:hypothetical protein
MKKLLFSATIMMIVTSPALAGGMDGIGDCKGCNSSAYQEVFGPPDVPLAAYPRGYTYSPGYITSYGAAHSALRASGKRPRHHRENRRGY